MYRLVVLLAALFIAMASQAAEYAFLGVVLDKPTIVSAQGFKGNGLLLKQVVANGPAAKTGLRGGDILTHFDGKPVEDGDDLSFFLMKASPGTQVSLDWVRGGQCQKGTVKLGSRREPEMKQNRSSSGMRGSLASTAYLGIGSLDINSNLLSYFGAKSGHGILIDAIVKGSPADKAGLKVGDVLVDMDGRAVDSPGRLRRLMEGYRPGDKVRLGLVRSRQFLNVDVVFGSRDQSSLEDLDLPGFHEVPGLPDLPGIDGLRGFPGHAAVETALDVMWRIVGTPSAQKEN